MRQTGGSLRDRRTLRYTNDDKIRRTKLQQLLQLCAITSIIVTIKDNRPMTLIMVMTITIADGSIGL